MDKCDPVTGCVCKTGWTGNNCDEDIDECTVNPTTCGSDKICQNLEGSHACNCRAGYTKDSNDNCIGMEFAIYFNVHVPHYTKTYIFKTLNLLVSL